MVLVLKRNFFFINKKDNQQFKGRGFKGFLHNINAFNKN